MSSSAVDADPPRNSNEVGRMKVFGGSEMISRDTTLGINLENKENKT